MTLALQTPKIQYTGNGVLLLYPFTYSVQDDSELVVTIDEIPQVLYSDYTVENLTQEGGEILFVIAPADQTTILIARNTPITQRINYTPFDSFPADTHEYGLDKLTAIIQELKGDVQDGGTGAPNLVQSVFARVGHIIALAGDYTASLITYVNAFSGLVATNVQDAIDELKSNADDTQQELDEHVDDKAIHGKYYEQSSEPVGAVDGSWWYETP